MTLKEKILELLKQQPQTANSLSKALRNDKAQIRKLLLIMERKGLVTCKPEKRGKVIYKFWHLQAT